MGEYVLLDTSAFDTAIMNSDVLIRTFDSINTDYDRIVSTLLEQWKGRGANAFAADAKTVRTNVAGLFDRMKLMRDTLIDCESVFTEYDTELGDYNQKSASGDS